MSSNSVETNSLICLSLACDRVNKTTEEKLFFEQKQAKILKINLLHFKRLNFVL